jgi:hypothetical protein
MAPGIDHKFIKMAKMPRHTNILDPVHFVVDGDVALLARAEAQGEQAQRLPVRVGDGHVQHVLDGRTSVCFWRGKMNEAKVPMPVPTFDVFLLADGAHRVLDHLHDPARARPPDGPVLLIRADLLQHGFDGAHPGKEQNVFIPDVHKPGQRAPLQVGKAILARVLLADLLALVEEAALGEEDDPAAISVPEDLKWRLNRIFLKQLRGKPCSGEF